MVVSIASGQQIALTGPLDVHTAADVRALLHSALDAGSGDLYLDLAAVDRVDTTGLGVLVGAHRRARRLERRLVLGDARPQMLRMLRLTRLHRVLAVEPPLHG